MGLQYYSLLPQKWTWSHKSRVMTSSQSLGRAENVFFPCDCLNYGLAMVKNLSLPDPSIQCLLSSWDPNAQPSKSHLTALFWRSVIPVQPHQFQWFCIPKWVFTTGIMCSNNNVNQRGGWRGLRELNQPCGLQQALCHSHVSVSLTLYIKWYFLLPHK